MRHLLTRPFFDRPTLRVARDLLGKTIVRRQANKTMALTITEVEAYDGPHDRASHARFGRSPRAKIMFGKPGNFYVFFNYGIHWLLNVVTGPEEYPAAVLIRAGAYREPATGKCIEIKGPARLTKFLAVDGALNGRRISRASGLWIEDRGAKIPRKAIIASPRIGVGYAGPVWGKKPWNFTIPLKSLNGFL